MPAKLDLRGQRFSYLTVLGPAAGIGGKTAWTVRCDCGTQLTARTRDLRSGDRKSCGCKRHLTRHRHATKVPLTACHRLVRELWFRMAKEQTTAEEIAIRTGQHPNTLRNWRTKRNPHLPEFEAAVNALGGKLVIEWEKLK